MLGWLGIRSKTQLPENSWMFGTISQGYFS